MCAFADPRLYQETKTYTEVVGNKLIIYGPGGLKATATITTTDCPHRGMVAWLGGFFCSDCSRFSKWPLTCYKEQHVDGGDPEAKTCCCGSVEYGVDAECQHEWDGYHEVLGQRYLHCHLCRELVLPGSENVTVQSETTESALIQRESFRFGDALKVIAQFHLEAIPKKHVLHTKAYFNFMLAVMTAAHNSDGGPSNITCL